MTMPSCQLESTTALIYGTYVSIIIYLSIHFIVIVSIVELSCSL